MKYCSFFLLTGILLLQSFMYLFAQNSAPDLPQRTGTVMATQAMHFGDITIISGTSGGTVTVDHNGTRTSTGNIILLNLGNSPRQAIFEYKLCPGRLVNISYPATITLTGQNSGSMLLRIGSTNIGPSGSTFISNKGCDDTHYIKVGGTIEVHDMSSNPGGSYSGSFNITFIQE